MGFSLQGKTFSQGSPASGPAVFVRSGSASPCIARGRCVAPSKHVCRALDGSTARFVNAGGPVSKVDLDSQTCTSSTQQHTGAIEDPEIRANGPTASPAENWDMWCEYFRTMDELERQHKQAMVELKQAVAEEMYSQAAALKLKSLEIKRQDAVDQLKQQLKDALALEDYEKAAELRDDGKAWLQGWWSGHSDDDPQGHLLHVTGGFSRWVGKVYTPRDLAEASGVFHTPMGVPMSLSVKGRRLPNLAEAGTPAFEVFVVNDALGKYSTYPVSLQPPNFEEAVSSLWHSVPDPPPDMPGTLTPEEAKGLTDSIQIDLPADLYQEEPNSPGQGESPVVKSSFSPKEQEEVRRTLEELKEGASYEGSSPVSGADGPFLQPLVRWDPAMSPRDGSPPELPEPLPTARKGRSPGASSPWTSKGVSREEVELSRQPADLRGFLHDQFVFQVREEPASALRGPLGLSPEPVVEGSESSKASLPSSPLLDTSSICDWNRPSSTNPADPLENTWRRVAENVAKIQKQRLRRDLPKDQLAELIKTIAMALVNRGVTAEAVELVGASTRAASCKHVVYNRLSPSLSTSHDPFTGLYLGGFGGHGPELLQLSRGQWSDGEECVVGVKVTGDHNVPAGAVSFRAKIGRKHRLESRDTYPEELGVVGRYKGQGRVASPGYENPRWVDGELLVFNSSPNSKAVTAGADLGFVWAVPGEKRFLILLNRLRLEP